MIYCFFFAGPVSNIIIVRQPTKISQNSLPRKQELLLMAPPLNKYIVDSREDEVESKAVKLLHQNSNYFDGKSYCAAHVMNTQIKELQVSSFTSLFFFFF